MKTGTNSYYPNLRRAYASLEELGRVINRNRRTVWCKLNGKSEFTATEMFLILDDLTRRGIIENKQPDNYKLYFTKEGAA